MFNLEEIKSIPIQDVCNLLGIRLDKRSGANIFGKLRNEKTSSFSINPEKNIWRDWGINKGGSTIDLVMEVEGLDRGKAIKYLADSFNIQGEKNEYSSLPSKNQFKEIGIISDRAIANFDINLEVQSIEAVEKLEDKYSVSMFELSKTNPTMYHRLINKKALPLIDNDRAELISMFKKYVNSESYMEMGIYKNIITEIDEKLNKRIDIYNRSRLDNVNLDKKRLTIEELEKSYVSKADIENMKATISQLKEKIANSDETDININFTKEALNEKIRILSYYEHQKDVQAEEKSQELDRVRTVQMLALDGEQLDIPLNALKVGIALHEGGDFYSFNIVADSLGKVIGFEPNESCTIDKIKDITSGDLKNFLDEFYYDTLFENLKDIKTTSIKSPPLSLDEIVLESDFHIWKKDTKVNDIIEWLSNNRSESTNYFEDYETNYFGEPKLDVNYKGELRVKELELISSYNSKELMEIILSEKNTLPKNINLDTAIREYLEKIDNCIMKGETYMSIGEYLDEFSKNISNALDQSLSGAKMTSNSELLNRYYLTQRPPSIGTHPNGAKIVKTFDSKITFEGVECWGYVEYDKYLTNKQISDYELKPQEKFNDKQINFLNSQIEKGFKVFDYNSPEYDVWQMGKIAYALENNLDISKLANPNLTEEEMIDIIESLEGFNSEKEIVGDIVGRIDYLSNSGSVEYSQSYYDIEAFRKELSECLNIGVPITYEEFTKKPLIDMKIDKDIDLTNIMDSLKNGVGNIFENKKFMQYLDFQSKFHNYSPNNNLLISIQNPEATQVASFTKWKSLGRTVNKGEKGIMILAPNTVKFGAKEIINKLEGSNKVTVGRYTFNKEMNNTYSISSKGYEKKNLSKAELENFIKVNKIQAQAIVGFKKTYVFDVSQTSGQPLPEYKIELKDNSLLDNNGFYKNPLLKFHFAEGGTFEQGEVVTFKQAYDRMEMKELEVRELKAQAQANNEYYPYMKHKFDVILSPESHGIARDIRVDVGDGEYNNLLEALKGEMKGYPNVFNTLEQTLNSNDNSMEIILGIKTEIENLCKSKGISFEYIENTGSANGYFKPNENKICVNANMDFSQKTKTLVHEYVHSQLHQQGYDPKISKDNLSARSVAEIEAESVAYVVSKHFGFDTSEYSFEYVSGWAKGKEMATLTDTLNNIKKTSERIINEIKSPLELSLYNNKTNVQNILLSENVKPTDKIINSILSINKATGKINTISDLKTAEKYKTYGNNKELTSKISEVNKDIKANLTIKQTNTKVMVR